MKSIEQLNQEIKRLSALVEKQHKESLQRNKAKSEFLANLRHDMRTPLSSIVNFSELLKSESNDPRIKEYADNIIASSHALQDLMSKQLPKSLKNIEIPATETIHVLVVEDNIIAQMVAKELLSKLFCQVDIASNGQDAITLCDKNQYHLIFMDLGLGAGMDGYEVTRHIRNKTSAIKNVPIIALTAHAGDDNKQRCIETGMDAVLTKPLTQAHAMDILKTFVLPKHIETPKIPEAKKDLPDNEDELFQLEQFALLDHEQALQNFGGDINILTELLTLMITKELPADLEAMKKAYALQDYSAIETLSHKIKSGAEYAGTTRMKYACQYVERYWKAGEREFLDKLVHQAFNTIVESCAYIEKWLKKRSK